ncbi:MAG: YkgJ family cysteine cluster protein [Planctomycetaceae bacterium]|nr:YkgJ family cysteine cluster protein [Planctomycetaceae bacterium]
MTSDPETADNNNSSKPWYNDGLQFTCTQCGDCCTGAPGVVWVSEEEIAKIAEYLDKPIGEIRLFHTRRVRGRVSLTEFQNGDCTFFDPQKRHCKVYPVRPMQCQTWPFWTSNLSSPEKWKQTCEYCPGSGEGAFFSLEEIEERASRVDI